MKKLTTSIVVIGVALLASTVSIDGQRLQPRIPSMDDSRDELLEEATQAGNTKLLELLRNFDAMHGGFKYDTGTIWVPGDIETLFDWNWTAPVDGNHDFQRVRDRQGKHWLLFAKTLEELERRKKALIDAGVMEAPAPSQVELDEAARVENLYPAEMELPDETPVYAQQSNLSGDPKAVLPAGSVIESYEKSPDGTACHIMQRESPWAEGWISAVSFNGFVCGLQPVPPPRERYAPRGIVDISPTHQVTEAPKQALDTEAAKQTFDPVAAPAYSTATTNSLTILELIALGGVGLFLLALNPGRTMVGFAFAALGLPVWWWMYQSISGGLNEFSDPSTLGGAVLHSARSYIWSFSVFWVLFFIVSFIRHVNQSKPVGASSGAGHIRAESGVPHCRFALNNAQNHTQGFKVDLFNSNGREPGVMVVMLLGITLAIWYFVASVTPTFMLVLVLGSALAYFLARRPHTHIEVNPSWIIIDGSPLARTEFRNFYLWSPRLLGCEYGLRRFTFGGEWTTWKATEIAAALNLHLARTPAAAFPATPATPHAPIHAPTPAPEESTPRRRNKY